MHSNRTATPGPRPAHFDDQHQAERLAWIAGTAAGRPRASTLPGLAGGLLAVAVGALLADWATGEVIATRLAILLVSL